MEENSILIIVARINEDSYQEQIRYLQELDIPNNYEVSILSVDLADTTISIANIYQNAMKIHPAKYKVYLKPGTVIINRTFLDDIMKIFHRDEKIGMVGMLGTKQLSTTGMLSLSSNIYGKLLLTNGKQINGENIQRSIEEVMTVSNVVIATQYDLKWRTDIFDEGGYDFVIESQCIEFSRNGYKVVVPKQEDYWIIAEPDKLECNICAQKNFLQEYGYEIYPLVSVVIPTYQRIELFKQALESVLNQDYKNLDIFITDNSPGNQTAELVHMYQKKDHRIIYEHHPDFNAGDNWNRAISYNNPDAEYVNWLMDDDVFLPNKISVMMDAFFKHPSASLVTSYRKLIDINGRFYDDAEFNYPIVDRTSLISGEEIGKQILLKQLNFIGEPTTALIKKKCMLNNRLGWTGKEGKYLISDFPTWLRCMEYGDLVYIREPLSYFRVHRGQSQNDMSLIINGAIAWALEVQNAINDRIFLKKETECRKTILCWFTRYSKLMYTLPEDMWKNDNCRDLLKVFESMGRALNNGYYIDFEIDTSIKTNVDGRVC